MIYRLSSWGENLKNPPSPIIFFSNFINMATDNEEPDLAETPMPIATPFTLAIRSIASSRPANATRNRATRRGLQSPLDY